MSETNNTTDWKKAPLSQLGNVSRGISYDSDCLVDKDEGVPYINMKSFLKGGGYNKKGLKYYRGPYSEKDVISKSHLLIANTDVTRDGDIIGCPAVLPEELWDREVLSSHHVSSIYVPNYADPKYFYYLFCLEHYRIRMREIARGTTVLMLDPEEIERIEIDLPPVEEQRKIAEILSTIDKAIEQTEAIIAKQQRIKTGLMQDLLTRGIDEHGNLRSEETHQFKDSPLGRIPVEWTVKALSNLVDEGITYGIVQAGPHIENGVPYIRTGDMTGNAINVRTLLRTSKKIAESYNRSAVYFGDIVFALRATVGKVLPVTKELDGANLTQGTAKISPKDSIDSTFLLWAIRTSKVQDAIRLEQKGTTFMEITLGDLRGIRLALPKEKDEQSVIAKKLDKHDCLRRNYVNHRDKLLSLKTALMQDLLTGKIRVTELLKQITTTAEGVA